MKKHTHKQTQMARGIFHILLYKNNTTHTHTQTSIGICKHT